MHSESHLTRICRPLGFRQPLPQYRLVVATGRARLRWRDASDARRLKSVLNLTCTGHDSGRSAATRGTFAVNCRLTALNHEAVMSTEIPALAGSYLTPDEVAARFRVRRRTVERLVAAKRFPPPLHFGRCVRFPAADVEAYEKSGGVWPPKKSP